MARLDNILIGRLLLLSIFLLLVQPVYAECSKERINLLVEQGKTLSRIAKLCDMTRTEIREAVDEEEDVPPSSSKPKPGRALEAMKTPVGVPISPCGCYGNEMFGARRLAPACQSGYAGPSICGGVCHGGGSPWQAVCVN